MLRESEAVYGDLHFHTRYSDNRDEASVLDMVRAGIRYGLTVFGTGDHNHNMNALDWEEQSVETRRAAVSHPELVLLNNSEVTFRLGHFLVFSPSTMDGSVKEGCDYLLRRRSAMVILNHPIPELDEWEIRRPPFAADVEVIPKRRPVLDRRPIW